jgi:hypothetical protein
MTPLKTPPSPTPSQSDTMREKLKPTTCHGAVVKIIGEPPLKALIYGVRENASSPFVYVGSTTQSIRRRMTAHVRDVKAGSDLPFHRWLSIRLKGLEVVVLDVVVLDVVSEHARHDREKYWVRTHSATLLNVTDGGPGMSGHAFAGTRHAQRIAAAIKTGDNFECHRCGTTFWRKDNEIKKGHNKFCSRVCSNARHKGSHHVEA